MLLNTPRDRPYRWRAFREDLVAEVQVMREIRQLVVVRRVVVPKADAVMRVLVVETVVRPLDAEIVV
jgi:hypothetical protein